uniref:Uncharacterized protein n=1 Tax=Arundo donax TaxID=35708 RepID=A0A0A9FTF6_ARUDO
MLYYSSLLIPFVLGCIFVFLFMYKPNPKCDLSNSCLVRKMP